jgi:hypothetical protein
MKDARGHGSEARGGGGKSATFKKVERYYKSHPGGGTPKTFGQAIRDQLKSKMINAPAAAGDIARFGQPRPSLASGHAGPIQPRGRGMKDAGGHGTESIARQHGIPTEHLKK